LRFKRQTLPVAAIGTPPLFNFKFCQSQTKKPFDTSVFIMIIAPVLMVFEKFPRLNRGGRILDAALFNKITDYIDLAFVFFGSIENRGGGVQSLIFLAHSLLPFAPEPNRMNITWSLISPVIDRPAATCRKSINFEL
jgi:hypothetical protein